MEMNLSLDFNFSALIGKQINLFYGEVMSMNNIDGHHHYQFSKGIVMLLQPGDCAYSFTGKIIELPNYEDSFDLSLSILSQIEIEFFDKSMLQYRSEIEGHFLKIEKVDLFKIHIPSLNGPKLFGLHFHCAENQNFLIHFNFPEDGLAILFDKGAIENFLKNDSFGKKLFLEKTIA